MKKTGKVLALVLIMALFVSCASAENYVNVVELRQQVDQGWEKGDVVIPPVEQMPVMSVVPDDTELANPYVVTIGTFDENASGKFQTSTRYGRKPPYTGLTAGLTLSEAQSLLDNELNNLFGNTLDDYSLIWTEIAKWKNMETWLLYYGQKFEGITCFNAGLTMDARTETYRHMIIPHWKTKQAIYNDVPLADWQEVQKHVDAFLQGKSAAESIVLELGYLMQEAEARLVPVWHLSYVTSGGYTEAYFSAQTGEHLIYWMNEYQVPEPFGWK